MNRSATMSADGRFRYHLARVWNDALPPLLFVMLNPSTADATQDDATIRKCVGFAERKGFGSIRVVNLFAYRATHPQDLAAAGWPVGDYNAQWIEDATREVAAAGGTICAAWGAHARGRPEADAVLAVLNASGAPVRALRLLADGVPSHPLMLAYASELVPLVDWT